ncbi:hypothetical protein VTP01DRAFT_7138 [Rhizomucor pusillus]|uniref:uncharacterized protein n=1 Tax=Rhizomucor pusillus TaxID=4840 RepID=UPI0037431378
MPAHRHYKQGDKVVYRPLAGTQTTSIGTIERVITSPEGSGKVQASASQDHPCYFIHNENTGKSTMYAEEAIEGPASEQQS